MVGLPSEQAALVIEGVQLRNWDSVMVHRVAGFPISDFRFTAAEADPNAALWNDIRAKPGDRCTILLGGELAFTGRVNWRQVAYDAHRHGVMIAGLGAGQDIADSSASPRAVYKKTKLEAIAEKEFKPYKVRLKLDRDSGTPFQIAAASPSETVFNFIDRLARIRGFTLTEDVNGDIAGHSTTMSQGGDSLVEGVNIKAAQCTIQDPSIFSDYMAYGQGKGSDSNWGKKVNQFSAKATDPLAKAYRFKSILAPRLIETIEDLKTHLDFEVSWRRGINIDCVITVYGWQKSDGRLWEVGKTVHVQSPMLLLNQTLFIGQVTFMQDAYNGTTTVLTLTENLGRRYFDYSAGNPPGAGSPEPSQEGTPE